MHNTGVGDGDVLGTMEVLQVPWPVLPHYRPCLTDPGVVVCLAVNYLVSLLCGWCSDAKSCSGTQRKVRMLLLEAQCLKALKDLVKAAQKCISQAPPHSHDSKLSRPKPYFTLITSDLLNRFLRYGRSVHAALRFRQVP
jgi:hypothetical protein